MGAFANSTAFKAGAPINPSLKDNNPSDKPLASIEFFGIGKDGGTAVAEAVALPGVTTARTWANLHPNEKV
jgi:hypothetical protein